MKTVINNTKGVVTYESGNKIILETTDTIELKGDVTIAGTTTTNARVDDRIIELAYGTTGSRDSGLEDAGVIIERGDDANVFFGWDESTDLFTVGTGTFTGVSTGPLSLSLAGIKGSTITGSEGVLSPALTGSATITVPAGGLIVGSTAVNSTAAELNLLDGSAKSASSITIADADAFLVIDGNTTKQIPASDIKTYIGTLTLDIDGATDIGAALVDADLLMVDDGANGSNRKTAMSRVKTYVSDLTLTTAAQTNVTSLGTLTALTVSGDLTVDTSTLYVDSSNNRVGIGTTSPGFNLHVKPSSGNARIQLESDDNSADVELRLDCASSTRNAVVKFYNAATDVGGIGYVASDEIMKMWGSNNLHDDHLCIKSNGLIGIGTASPTEKLDVNSDAIRIRSSQTPGSADATGTAGMICWDSDYIYVCVDTNTWKRVAIATW